MPTATKFRIPPPPASSSADGGAAESSVGGGDQGPRPDSSRPDADARAAREDASPARSRAGTVNAGAWTADEHRLFLAGLEVHGEPPRAAAGSIGGTDWAAVASAVGSRTADQVRSHATTYFKRLARARPAPVAAAGPPRRTSGRSARPVANFADETFASASNSTRRSFGWTAEEDGRLAELVGEYPRGSRTAKWKKIAAKMPGEKGGANNCTAHRSSFVNSLRRAPFDLFFSPLRPR